MADPIDDGGAHLDDIRAPEIGAETGHDDDVVDPNALELEGDLEGDDMAETMSKDAFWTVFNASFAIPGGFMPDFQPLAIQPQEEKPARMASDAIFDLLQIYYPRALMPMGDTFALILTAAPFLFAKVRIVQLILIERRRPKQVVNDQANDQAKSAAQGGGAKEPEFKSRRGNSPLQWMDAEGSA